MCSLNPQTQASEAPCGRRLDLAPTIQPGVFADCGARGARNLLSLSLSLASLARLSLSPLSLSRTQTPPPRSPKAEAEGNGELMMFFGEDGETLDWLESPAKIGRAHV